MRSPRDSAVAAAVDLLAVAVLLMCFGVFWGRPLTWWTVVEDVVLMLASYVFYKFSQQRNATKL